MRGERHSRVRASRLVVPPSRRRSEPPCRTRPKDGGELRLAQVPDADHDANPLADELRIIEGKLLRRDPSR